MVKKDPRVDAYIKKAQPFARPILKHLRKIVHAGCPNCEESIKWQSPFFDYKGPVCFMAAFKQHAVFGFWKGKLLFGSEDKGAMGHFGRLTSKTENPVRLGCGVYRSAGGGFGCVLDSSQGC